MARFELAVVHAAARPGRVRIGGSRFQGIRLAQAGENVVTVDNARRPDGPSERVRRGRFQALLGPHSMARSEQGAAKIPVGTAALTE